MAAPKRGAARCTHSEHSTVAIPQHHEISKCVQGDSPDLTPGDRGTLDPKLVKRGERLFQQAGCLSCHNGKSYGGKDIFFFGNEGQGQRLLATDRTLERFADPDLDGTLCCDLMQLGHSEVTHGLKAPHLTGIWAHRRYLHNGSLDSLEELLCYDGPRPESNRVEGMNNQGHSFGCDLAHPDKDAVLEFLRSL